MRGDAPLHPHHAITRRQLALLSTWPPVCWASSRRVWTPKYWTSRSVLTFNFTGFLDYESGITHYQWGIGTRKQSADVVPLTDTTTTRVLKDIRDAVGNTQRMYVTPVVSVLPVSCCRRAAGLALRQPAAQADCWRLQCVGGGRPAAESTSSESLGPPGAKRLPDCVRSWRCCRSGT